MLHVFYIKLPDVLYSPLGTRSFPSLRKSYENSMQILLFLKEATTHVFICSVFASLKVIVVWTLKRQLFLATNIRISIRFNMSTEVLRSASSNSSQKKENVGGEKSFAAECAGINHPICLDSDNNLIKCEHFNSRS